MRPLSSSELLTVWEQGHDLHGVDQALLVLACACPDYIEEALVKLSLGQRDGLLLQVRQRTFGDRIDARTECPGCQDTLEFSTTCHALLVEAQELSEKTITIEGIELNLRSPDSRDAAIAATSDNAESAARVLVSRCVTRTSGSETSMDILPESIRLAIARELAAIDPQAEVLLNLSCPSCGHRWQGLFDIVSFLWAEIRARAGRLVQEIDALARVYGWTEADILAMSGIRRRLYLQMAVS